MTLPAKLTILLALGRQSDPEPWINAFKNKEPDRLLEVWKPGAPPPENYALCSWETKPEVYHMTPKPRLICSPGAGVDHIVLAKPPDDVPVTRIIDHSLTNEMTAYVTLHTLYHARHMSLYAAAQKEKRWRRLHTPPLSDVCIGIMGSGALGVAAAETLKNIGFSVICWGRSPRKEFLFPYYCGQEERSAFLSKTNILICLLPLTPDTRHLINKDVFAQLAPSKHIGGPCFINCGRGRTVNQADLTAALASGELFAASLDVFEKEPLPPTDTLWSLPNVLITPHCAAVSDPQEIAAVILEEIARYEKGLPLMFEVKKDRAY